MRVELMFNEWLRNAREREARSVEFVPPRKAAERNVTEGREDLGIYIRI